MGYLIYSITFLFLITATALYATRSLWVAHAPPIPYLTAPGPIPDWLYDIQSSLRTQRYIRLPSVSSPSSFAHDAEAGFSSTNFDLAQNIEAGDSRRGLDEEGKKEVLRVMKSRGLGFDEARRVVVEERFGRENIGADGRPLDRKAVMFDRL